MEAVDQKQVPISEVSKLTSVLDSYKAKEVFKRIDSLDLEFLPSPKPAYQFFRCKLVIGKELFYWPIDGTYISIGVDHDDFIRYLDSIKGILDIPFKSIPVEFSSHLLGFATPLRWHFPNKNYLRDILLARLQAGA